MKLVYRRFMFWLGVIIFFVIGPALIFYAQGYRVIPKDITLVTTGTMVVSSRPVNSAIILNGQDLDITTPYTIDSLEPNDYLLTLSHPDYLPWSKELSVKAGRSTFASDVRLIKNVGSESIAEIDHLFYDNESRRGYLTLKQLEDGLYAQFNRSQLFGGIVSPNRNVIVPIVDSNEVKVVAWAPLDDRLILYTDNRFWLLDFTITEQAVKELTAIIPENYKQIHWSGRNTEELIVTSSNKITLVNLATVTKRDILNKTKGSEVFSDAFTIGNTVYAISTTNESAVLNTVNLAGDSNLVSPLNGTHHEYIEHDSDIMILRTREGQLQIYHSNNASYRPGRSFDNVKEVVFNEGDLELLFTTGSELYVFSILDNSLNLIVRQAKLITDIDWFNDSHVSYLSDQTVYLIERDGRNGHISWELANQLGLKDYFINNSFNKLFFVAQKGETTWLFQREI